MEYANSSFGEEAVNVPLAMPTRLAVLHAQAADALLDDEVTRRRTCSSRLLAVGSVNIAGMASLAQAPATPGRAGSSRRSAAQTHTRTTLKMTAGDNLVVLLLAR